MTIHVRPATPGDSEAWLRMRLALWPDSTDAEHRVSIEQYFSGHRRDPQETLIAFDAAGSPVGFVELSIRNIVDSCATDRVGYVEGWYVSPDVRRRGIGRALVEAAEAWAIEQGCTEFGSDALIDNLVSQTAHAALGFVETGRVCNFRKDLSRYTARARRTT